MSFLGFGRKREEVEPEEECDCVGILNIIDSDASAEAFVEWMAEQRRVMGLPAYTYAQALTGQTEYCGLCRNWFAEVHIH